jgi:16S rRNA (cytidine1402-2'-O)-methyltransferase
LAQFTLVTVPIGNTEDITERAKKKLIEGKIILSEDTRKLKVLLQGLGIDYKDKVIFSFHDHSGDKEIQKIIDFLENGEDLLLVSDAGSPVISDPGHKITKALLSKGYDIAIAPGVSSVTAALELSGLAPIPFHFHGFYPREKNKKEGLIKKIETQKGTHIFFESPKRVLETLEQLAQIMPLFSFGVCREMTKTYESIYRFLGNEFHEIKNSIVEKGEFVVLIQNNLDEKFIQNLKAIELANEYLNGKKTTKKLAKILSELLDIDAKEVYKKLCE